VKDLSDEVDCCSSKVESDRDRRQREATRSEVGGVGKSRQVSRPIYAALLGTHADSEEAGGIQ
jgi:hypothetical protein